MIKEKVGLILTIAIGIFVGAIALWTLNVTVNNNARLNQVINFLNGATAPATPPAVK